MLVCLSVRLLACLYAFYYRSYLLQSILSLDGIFLVSDRCVPSPTSNLLVLDDLMNLYRSMFLRQPLGSVGCLAGVCIAHFNVQCTFFSIVKIGVYMLRVPLYLAGHVGILQICLFCVECTGLLLLVYASPVQKTWRRPDGYHLGFAAIILNKSEILSKTQCIWLIIIDNKGRMLRVRSKV